MSGRCQLLGGVLRVLGSGAPPGVPLQGAVALVTGGGAGIGRATSQLLAAEGAVVVVADRDPEAAAETASALGGPHLARALDVVDRASFSALMDEVEEQLGPIDLLVNNAGIMPLSPLAQEDDAVTARILEVNLHAVIHGTREAVRRMVPRGRGHIVNISSTAGRAGLAGGATYSASKWGVIGFSEAVHSELAGTGVELTVVLPAIVNTSLGEGVDSPLGMRRVEPDDVAGAIVAAVRRPRFEVYTPWEAGPLAHVGAVLPQRLRDAVARMMGLNHTLVHADDDARAEYEARVRSG